MFVEPETRKVLHRILTPNESSRMYHQAQRQAYSRRSLGGTLHFWASYAVLSIYIDAMNSVRWRKLHPDDCADSEHGS